MLITDMVYTEPKQGTNTLVSSVSAVPVTTLIIHYMHLLSGERCVPLLYPYTVIEVVK